MGNHVHASLVRTHLLDRLYSYHNASLSAGLLRQATYTTTRLGAYNALFEYFRYADISVICTYLLDFLEIDTAILL